MVLLVHEVAPDLERGTQFASGDRELVRKDSKLLDLIRPRNGLLVRDFQSTLDGIVKFSVGRVCQEVVNGTDFAVIVAQDSCRPVLNGMIKEVGRILRFVIHHNLERKQARKELPSVADDDDVGDHLRQSLPYVLFDVKRRNVLASRGDDQFLEPPTKSEEAVSVEAAKISGSDEIHKYERLNGIRKSSDSQRPRSCLKYLKSAVKASLVRLSSS